MTPYERFLYMQATEQELHWLCNKIVTDGRDPYWVAEAMTRQVGETLKEYQSLWDAAKEGENE